MTSTMRNMLSSISKLGDLLVKAFGWLLGVGFVVGMLYGGFDWLNKNGYITYHRDVDTYMSGEWLVGENRACYLSSMKDADGKPTGFPLDLRCPLASDEVDTNPHNMNIAFHGDMRGHDIDGTVIPLPYLWICTREAGGFVCRLSPK